MKTLNIARRIIRQIFNDKRSLALFLIAPGAIFTVVLFLVGDSGYQPSVAAANVQPVIVEKIEAQGVTVKTVTLDEGKQLVEDEQTDALIYSENGGLTLLFRSYDATKTGLVQKSVADALRSLSPGASMQTEYLYGETGSSTFDSIGYAMLGVIAFFVTFIIAG
ncbi:MAG: ABC transporter permease, partial [Bacillota bacterium]|nr:ABC transporter permease [Bacillota bacterium]